MVLQLFGSVSGRAQRRDNGHCLASGVLSGRKLFPDTHPDARNLNSFPYAAGALPAAAWVLEPRESGSA